MTTFRKLSILATVAVAQGGYFETWTDVNGWAPGFGDATLSNPGSGGNTSGADDGYLS